MTPGKDADNAVCTNLGGVPTSWVLWHKAWAIAYILHQGYDTHIKDSAKRAKKEHF